MNLFVGPKKWGHWPQGGATIFSRNSIHIKYLIRLAPLAPFLEVYPPLQCVSECACAVYYVMTSRAMTL